MDEATSMRCAVQVRLVGPRLQVESVAEYLRQSRRLVSESEDRQSREDPQRVIRYLEVTCDEKQGHGSFSR